METMEGMGGFGAAPGSMADMSSASLIGGMGALPGAIGGMSSGVPHTPSHEDAVKDLANTFRASRDEDATRSNEEEEEESSSEESDGSEEDEDEDEDEA